MTTITIKKACAEFLGARAEGLTRRALRNYQEVLDLWVEFLDDHGIGSIDLVASTATGRKTGTVEQVLGLLDEFNDDYLVTVVKAERDFLRSAGVVSRDFSRWLKSLTSRPSRRADEAAMAGRAHA
ncbi:MAG: hypothetical protein R3B09_04385 [Nannocystaceae bacterium]